MNLTKLNTAPQVRRPCDRLEDVLHVVDSVAASGQDRFYPDATLTFRVADGSYCHVPLLLSPFACSTYRGS